MVDYNTTQQHTREHIIGDALHVATFGSCVFVCDDDAHDTRDACIRLDEVTDCEPDDFVAETDNAFVMRDTRDDIDNDPAFASSTDDAEYRRTMRSVVASYDVMRAARNAADVTRVALSLMESVQHAADDDALDGAPIRVVPTRERWYVAYSWSREALRDMRERAERDASA